jgi:hypothetical protein
MGAADRLVCCAWDAWDGARLDASGVNRDLLPEALRGDGAGKLAGLEPDGRAAGVRPHSPWARPEDALAAAVQCTQDAAPSAA